MWKTWMALREKIPDAIYKSECLFHAFNATNSMMSTFRLLAQKHPHPHTHTYHIKIRMDGSFPLTAHRKKAKNKCCNACSGWFSFSWCSTIRLANWVYHSWFGLERLKEIQCRFQTIEKVEWNTLPLTFRISTHWIPYLRKSHEMTQHK